MAYENITQAKTKKNKDSSQNQKVNMKQMKTSINSIEATLITKLSPFLIQ